MKSAHNMNAYNKVDAGRKHKHKLNVLTLSGAKKLFLNLNLSKHVLIKLLHAGCCILFRAMEYMSGIYQQCLKCDKNGHFDQTLKLTFGSIISSVVCHIIIIEVRSKS